MTPAEVEAATRRFRRAIVERALVAELMHDLGYVRGEIKPDDVAHLPTDDAATTLIWLEPRNITVAEPRTRYRTWNPLPNLAPVTEPGTRNRTRHPEPMG